MKGQTRREKEDEPPARPTVVQAADPSHLENELRLIAQTHAEQNGSTTHSGDIPQPVSRAEAMEATKSKWDDEDDNQKSLVHFPPLPTGAFYTDFVFSFYSTPSEKPVSSTVNDSGDTASKTDKHEDAAVSQTKDSSSSHARREKDSTRDRRQRRSSSRDRDTRASSRDRHRRTPSRDRDRRPRYPASRDRYRGHGDKDDYHRRRNYNDRYNNNSNYRRRYSPPASSRRRNYDQRDRYRGTFAEGERIRSIGMLFVRSRSWIQREGSSTKG